MCKAQKWLIVLALNIYDLLYHEQLIISEAAVKELEQLLGPNKEAEAVAAPTLKKKLNRLQAWRMSRQNPSVRESRQ